MTTEFVICVCVPEKPSSRVFVCLLVLLILFCFIFLECYNLLSMEVSSGPFTAVEKALIGSSWLAL